ncbi:MAG: cell division protein FtsH, partial [Cellulomonadaceae bacterium]|nr:cell division protein FtsH [Cellulomonadaceae bacterium]
VFESVVKRDPRTVWLSSDDRPVSDLPPVLTAREKAASNGAPVVPQDEAAAAHEEHPARTIGEVPPDAPVGTGA